MFKLVGYYSCVGKELFYDYCHELQRPLPRLESLRHMD